MGGAKLSSGLTESTERVELDRRDNVEEIWDEPDLPETRSRTDLELLQGAWVAVSGLWRAQLLIAGGRFTVRFHDGAIYMGTFDLDAGPQPKILDMHIEEGPSKYKGKTALSIYELDGGVLRWCTAGPGKEERLPDFPAEQHPHHLDLVFQREASSV